MLLRVSNPDGKSAWGSFVVDGLTDPHAYFEALQAHPSHWRSYSLRDPTQLLPKGMGGYANSNSAPLDVTYAPGLDTHPHRQDAAKVTIGAFQLPEGAQSILVADIDAETLTLPLSDRLGDVTKVTTSYNSKGRQIKIDDEIIILNENVTPLDRATGIVTLSQRGAYGTTATSHAAGTPSRIGGNSLANQIRVPVESHDGAQWMITWDYFLTDSWINCGIGNYKAFQLSSGGDKIWWEPQLHFDGGGKPRPDTYVQGEHVAVTGRARSYNRVGGPADWALTDGNSLGPGVTDNNPVVPALPVASPPAGLISRFLQGIGLMPTTVYAGGPFFPMMPNRWTRQWVLVDQRANDYDRLSVWVSDTETDAVQVYDDVPVSVRSTGATPNSIDKFWLEFNTSTAYLPQGRIDAGFVDLVAYVRTIAVLKDPGDIAAYLQRPEAHL